MANKKRQKIIDLKFFQDRCDFCGCCIAVCPVDCIDLEETQLTVNLELCTFCGNCPKACPVGALIGEMA